MEQLNNEKLNIEDILKEFGGSAADNDIPADEIFVADDDPDEDVVVWDGKPAPRESGTPAMPQETIRLEQITKEVKQQVPVSDETVAFTPVTEQTVVFKPVTDETVAFTPVTLPTTIL